MIEVGQSLKSAWKDRITYDTADGKLTVVSPEGLLMMKRRAGRPQDLVDADKLEGKSE